MVTAMPNFQHLSTELTIKGVAIILVQRGENNPPVQKGYKAYCRSQYPFCLLPHIFCLLALAALRFGFSCWLPYCLAKVYLTIRHSSAAEVGSVEVDSVQVGST